MKYWKIDKLLFFGDYKINMIVINTRECRVKKRKIKIN